MNSMQFPQDFMVLSARRRLHKPELRQLRPGRARVLRERVPWAETVDRDTREDCAVEEEASERNCSEEGEVLREE